MYSKEAPACKTQVGASNNKKFLDSDEIQVLSGLTDGLTVFQEFVLVVGEGIGTAVE